MPLGVLSDEEFESEIRKIVKESNFPGKVIDKEKLGRPEGKKEVPESARKLIGELALTESPEDLAREFGISPSSISAYKNGATSTSSYNSPEPSLKNHINLARTKIVNRARKKLNLALSGITEEKLAECKVRDLSGIAKDMSQVIRNMEPDKESGSSMNGNFIFLVPPMVSEDKYPVIDVTD